MANLLNEYMSCCVAFNTNTAVVEPTDATQDF